MRRMAIVSPRQHDEVMPAWLIHEGGKVDLRLSRSAPIFSDEALAEADASVEEKPGEDGG